MKVAHALSAHVRWALTVLGLATAFAVVPAGASHAATGLPHKAKIHCPAGTSVSDYCQVAVLRSRR